MRSYLQVLAQELSPDWAREANLGSIHLITDLLPPARSPLMYLVSFYLVYETPQSKSDLLRFPPLSSILLSTTSLPTKKVALGHISYDTSKTDTDPWSFPSCRERYSTYVRARAVTYGKQVKTIEFPSSPLGEWRWLTPSAVASKQVEIADVYAPISKETRLRALTGHEGLFLKFIVHFDNCEISLARQEEIIT